jgi:hypothetical protein
MKTKNDQNRDRANNRLNYQTPNSSSWQLTLSIILIGFILIVGLCSASSAHPSKSTGFTKQIQGTPLLNNSYETIMDGCGDQHRTIQSDIDRNNGCFDSNLTTYTTRFTLE